MNRTLLLTIPHEYDPATKRLTIRGASEFPREVLDHADDIEILDMSYGSLSTLPNDLGRLHKLRIAFLSHNTFTEVPVALADCTSLRMVGLRSCQIKTIPDNALPLGLRGLILTENQLTSLPASIGKLVQLQKLMLAGNQLTDLPRELLNCKNLECVRIPVNQLTAQPDWLFELPRLAWYTDSGNPFNAGLVSRLPPTPSVGWSDIELADKIGESSKNTVHRARLRTTGEEVAVKLYGHALTTDGDPADEMHANIAAGVHPNLIGVVDTISGAPDDQLGLVLTLIPPEFRPMSLPPDFETLTRDVFPGHVPLTLAAIHQVLTDVASALQHMHERGVMHGDVYAHNLLANPDGRCYVADFGAASLYPPVAAHVRQLVDVRAFGNLIEDLLPLCTEEHSQLDKLRSACQRPDPADRPTFADITRTLAAAL